MSEALLLVCAASTLYLVGLSWFVHVVHYPLFREIDPARFGAYHGLHSRRTTWVVALPMVLELVTSVWLVADAPAGLEGLAVAGAVLAVAAWAITLFWAAPTHGAIGRQGPEPDLLHRLDRASRVRTGIWSFHGLVVLAMLAEVVGLP